MCTAFLGVYLHEVKLIPDTVDKMVDAIVRSWVNFGGSSSTSHWLRVRHKQEPDDSLEIHLTTDYHRVGLTSNLVHLLQADGVDFVVDIFIEEL